MYSIERRIQRVFYLDSVCWANATEQSPNSQVGKEELLVLFLFFIFGTNQIMDSAGDAANGSCIFIFIFWLFFNEVVSLVTSKAGLKSLLKCCLQFGKSLGKSQSSCFFDHAD